MTKLRSFFLRVFAHGRITKIHFQNFQQFHFLHDGFLFVVCLRILLPLNLFHIAGKTSFHHGQFDRWPLEICRKVLVISSGETGVLMSARDAGDNFKSSFLLQIFSIHPECFIYCRSCFSISGTTVNLSYGVGPGVDSWVGPALGAPDFPETSGIYWPCWTHQRSKMQHLEITFNNNLPWWNLVVVG